MSKLICGWIGLIGLVCMSAPSATAQSSTFDIYWVDVEGGAGTLMVSPTGESLLVDTGYPTDDDRDAQRIAGAAREAGLTRIDHLIITHYHRDRAPSAGSRRRRRTISARDSGALVRNSRWVRRPRQAGRSGGSGSSASISARSKS